MERSKVRVLAAAPSEGFLALTLAALCGGAQTQGVATGLWVGKLDQRPGTSPPHELWAESASCLAVGAYTSHTKVRTSCK